MEDGVITPRAILKIHIWSLLQRELNKANSGGESKNSRWLLGIPSKSNRTQTLPGINYTVKDYQSFEEGIVAVNQKFSLITRS